MFQTYIDIYIPSSVTTVGTNAFQNCTKLNSVIFGESSLVASIPQNAFNGCAGLISITIPNSVTSIGVSAFQNCTSLESVTLSSTLTTLGANSFRDCTSLESVTLPNTLKTLGGNSFQNCNSLESVTLSNSLTILESGLFQNCTSLKSIIIPDSVTEMKGSVFNGCTVLDNVTISKYVKTIGTNAFAGCKGLTAFEFKADSPLVIIDVGTFNNCINLTSIEIPKYVKTIGAHAFLNCTKLTYVTFENGSVLKDISYSVFSGTDLKSITIPSSVETIGDHTFSNCAKLESIMFEKPASLITINKNLFSGCTSLESIEIPNSVTTIEETAFNGCSKLTSVSFPNSVTSFVANAFHTSSVRTLIITYSDKNTTSAILGTSFNWKLPGQNGEVTNLIIEANNLSFLTIEGKTGKTVTFTGDATSTTGGLFYDPDGFIPMEGNDRASKIYSYDAASGKWLALKYTISFESNGGDSISDKRIFHGYNFTKPDNPERYGYIFEGWFADSELTDSYVFSTPVISDITLYAKWSPAFLSTITPLAGAGGWISPSIPQNDVPYDGITFSFGANEGYRIKDVKVDGVSVDYDIDSDGLGTYSFQKVEEGSYTIDVEFEAYHTIFANGLDNGNIEVDNYKPTHGDSVTITVKSDTGYTLKAFTDNGADVFSSATVESEGIWTYSIPSVTSDHEIVVTLAIITFEMTVDYSGEGTVNPGNSFIAEYGDNCTFKFKAAEGHYISKVLADGAAVDYNIDSNGVGRYSFLDITDNHTFEVIFVIYKYNVILTQGEEYTLVPAEGFSSPVNHGESFEFVFSLNEGYEQSKASVIVDGITVAKIDGKYNVTIVVTSIIKDTEIIVEDVVLNSYMVTADLNGGFFDTDPNGWTEETDGSYTKKFTHNTSYSTIITDLGIPERFEHSFDGFNPLSGELVTTGVILTAQWIINKYTVTVDLDDGSFDSVPNGWTKESDGSYTKEFDYGTPYSDIQSDIGIPEKTGHSFIDSILPSELLTVPVQHLQHSGIS